jgi:putative hydrolase of the HAD superfamily
MSVRWPIHTLVFDLDDTLFAERDFALGGFAAAGRWLEAEKGVVGLTDVARDLFERGVRGTIFDRALARLGCPTEPATVAGLVRAYREHCPVLSLWDDAAQCLDWACGRFRLALVTDGYRDVQERKIEALGLAEKIPCRILTDSLGLDRWKPSPAGFECVAAALPGAAEGFVYVGDNPRKDFIAPRQLGWRTIRIRRPGGEHAGYEPTPPESAERDIALLTELRALVTVRPIAA